MEQLNALLPADGAKTIAFVGAGGKTSAIYAFAREAAAAGRKVIVTTTTHMQYPQPEYGPLCTDAQTARTALSAASIAVCGIDDGVSPGGVHKITSLSADQLDQCSPKTGICDLLLIEADGARMLPLKVPASHEPVVPEGTDAVFICAGLDSIGAALSEKCFRQELAQKLLHTTEDHCIAEQDIASILYATYLKPLSKLSGITALYAMLNKADTSKTQRFGERTAAALASLAAGTSAAPLYKGAYITSLKKGLFYYERF